MTTLQASPKALSKEEAAQKLVRMRLEANSQHKAALRRSQKQLIEREPWLQEAIQEVVVYTARRKKLEERGVLPKRLLTDERHNHNGAGQHRERLKSSDRLHFGAEPEIGMMPTGELEPWLVDRLADGIGNALDSYDRVVDRRAKLKAEGRPLAGKVKAGGDHQPTIERLSKGDLTNKSDRTGNKAAIAPDIAHQVRDNLDNVWKHLTDRESAAIARLITNMEYARRVKSITANYEGTNGGGYGPRHGGLPDDVREAATVADWMLDKMHPEFQKLAKALAYGVQRDLDGRPLTKHEIMSLFFPEMGDKGRKDGGWIALCRSLSWRTIEREWELDDATKGETSQGANHVKQIIRERGA